MSLSTWRQFQFFESTPIKDPNFGSDEPLYSDSSLSSICATADYIILAVDNSFVKIVSREYVLIKKFNAYQLGYNITFLKSIPNSNLLVTLAEQQDVPSVIKLWDLTKILQLTGINSEDYIHKYHTTVTVSNGDNSFPISCFEINDDFTVVGIGYTNGKVIVVRGDLIKDRGSRQRVVYESNDPVTGLKFDKSGLTLFITTTSKILTVSTATGRYQGEQNRVLDKSTGVDLNCSAMDYEDSQSLIIAKHDSIIYYNQISKSHSLNFEISKRLIFKFKKYLLIVSPIETSRNVKITMLNSSYSNSNNLINTRILIIDLVNKYVTFNLIISNSISDVFSMWDDIYALSTDGILYKIHEKSLNKQIESVIQRNLYPVAVKLANDSNVSSKELLRIYVKFGDFQYEKQQYNESMVQYLTCLDLYSSLPDDQANKDSLTSYIMNVIQKFKDVSNINNLTQFLSKLYDLNLSNNDHLTLLLCCYCKSKQLEKIDAFINDFDLNDSNTKNSDTNYNELNYQLIINLFKECKYFQQSINLLHKLNQPNLIVEILLNDLKNFAGCLKFIKTLKIDELLRVLIEHSKKLLDNLPNETTELLIDVFTGRYTSEGSSEFLITLTNSNSDAETSETSPPSYSPLTSYKAFVAFMNNGINFDKDNTITSQSTSSSSMQNMIEEPTYLPPKPRIIFSSFINNPNEFVIFLEACVESYEKYQGNLKDKKDILITLYEMYLTLSQNSSDLETKSSWQEKAKLLATRECDLLDNSLFLLVSSLNNFDEGEILARDKSGFEVDLFRSRVVSSDVKGALVILHRYGETEPELYKLALNFIISSEEIFQECGMEEFQSILHEIKKRKLMTPLDVIQTLSVNSIATVGLIKDYLIEFITSLKQEIDNNEKLIESYTKESESKKSELKELITKPTILQNTRCSACNLKLDFPIVHFKCKHSFHNRCLNEDFDSTNNTQIDQISCVICMNEMNQIKTLRNNQIESKQRVDVFNAALNDSDDKLRVISDFFGRGVMENDVHIYDNSIEL